MSILDSIVLGIIEGITEFLPISSTGHLILSSKLLGLGQTEFLKSFEIAIQLGAILSVVVLYWRSFFVSLETLKRILAAFIPTALIGALLYNIVKGFLLSNEQVVLWSLLLGGIALILFEYWHKEKPDASEDIASMPYKTAALIGLAQSVAIIPGVSRAAATILGGLLLNLKRKTIVEFSFLLAVPTMAAATGLDLYKSTGQFSLDQFEVLAVGFIVSFLVAMGAIKFLLSFIQKHSFVSFGIYRIIVALVFWWIIL
ncbi:MAG: undecaprenyl-diphosphatase UppP [Candidatus Doudnabacteria bacterium]|nr:undecaprenyl-diphosphatase UppP [Candidatus Doudnabacteria bacterium]